MSQPQPADALESLRVADEAVSGLLSQWSEHTRQLISGGDKVEIRWERGSAVKLLIQQLAVREEASRAVVARLRDAGEAELASSLEGDGDARRAAMDSLDEVARGYQAISLNSPEIDRAVEEVRALVDDEMRSERSGVLDRVAATLGAPGERGLPSDRSVRMHSRTHPGTRISGAMALGPVRAVAAFFDHLRTSPTGTVSPDVDSSREHRPGP